MFTVYHMRHSFVLKNNNKSIKSIIFLTMIKIKFVAPNNIFRLMAKVGEKAFTYPRVVSSWDSWGLCLPIPSAAGRPTLSNKSPQIGLRLFSSLCYIGKIPSNLKPSNGNLHQNGNVKSTASQTSRIDLPTSLHHLICFCP